MVNCYTLVWIQSFEFLSGFINSKEFNVDLPFKSYKKILKQVENNLAEHWISRLQSTLQYVPFATKKHVHFLIDILWIWRTMLGSRLRQLLRNFSRLY